MKFRQSRDRSEAESLRGTLLFVEEAELGDLEPGGFWIKDLIGCEVVTVSGHSLGEMVEVLEGQQQDLWRVRTANGDLLVPAVKDIVKEVDLDGARIVIDPPEGLIEGE